ncbi:MAG: hypothetical protein GF313_01240 [Caldithrix sp.]|nr:hypothetical protein [Caldithrix sp.]
MKIKQYRQCIYFCFILLLLIAVMSCQEQKPQLQTWQKVAGGFQFPEGPAWSDDGKLLLSNCNGGWVARIHHDKVDTLVSDADSAIASTNGLWYHNSRGLLACDFGLGALLAIDADGQVQTLIDGYEGQPFNRPNDLVVMQERHVYFTDPHQYGRDKRDGRIFYYNLETGQLMQVADSLAFPNGIAVSPVNQRLYVCESARERILTYEITHDYKLTDAQVLIELPGGDPDGLEFDRSGNLYVAHFGGAKVIVISPEGQIVLRQDTPGSKPSNLEFGGPHMKTLYLTEDETNAVYKTTASMAGYRP